MSLVEALGFQLVSHTLLFQFTSFPVTLSLSRTDLALCTFNELGWLCAPLFVNSRFTSYALFKFSLQSCSIQCFYSEDVLLPSYIIKG